MEAFAKTQKTDQKTKNDLRDLDIDLFESLKPLNDEKYMKLSYISLINTISIIGQL